MSCQNCGTPRSENQQSCARCGLPFEQRCPVCGADNPPTHRFCSECGTLLQPAASLRAVTRSAPSRSERRVVTVLFADLVGFTTVSESRDPEDVRALLTAYFDRARETVARFGGSVDKFIGDAIMAVWGAVEAHEDDAERAVRAALELIDAVTSLGEELGVPLQARAGVLTGEASVGPGGNDMGLVVGDLVNTASRLQSLADPGTVVVGEPTLLTAGDAIQFEPLGPQPVKGKAEPVDAYRAVRVVTVRDSRARVDGLEPPFVGRDDELRLLKEQLHAVGREGRARLVSIVGEPGTGKDRLTLELQRYADGIFDTVLWHHGRSPSYGESLALWPVAEMVRSIIGIAEVDDASKSRFKLRTAIADLVVDESDRRWLEAGLTDLLGLGDGGSNDRDELFASLRTFFQRVAAHGVAVLVFEDLHQAEESTLDFIVDLVERSSRHPILVITLARPDLLHRVPAWHSDRHTMVSLHLSPLSDDAMRQMVAGTVPGLPDHAVEAMVSRAGGVPLYATELIRMLVASGEIVREGDEFRLTGDVTRIAVPDTLQAVIGARLDRLSPAERELVQDASILGLAFYLDGLRAIRGEDPEALRRQLDDLVNNELFVFEEDLRAPGGGRYRFTQNLIKEVAYGRLSRSDRRDKHLRVAEYLESLDEVELAGKVANHYLFAFEAAPQPEAGRLVERACTALCTAAERATSLQAHSQALRLWEQAVEITESAKERARLHEMAAGSAQRAGEFDRGIGHAALAAGAYEEMGDDDGGLRAATIQASIYNSSYHAPEAVALLEPLYGTAQGTGTTRLTLEIEFARALMLNHENARAAEVAERALGSAHGAIAPGVVVDGIITRATALSVLGREVEAAVLLQGATVLADEHQLHTQALRALNNLSVIVGQDSPRRSAELAMELLERGRQFGDYAWLYRALPTVADKHMDEGRFDEALDLLNEVDAESLPYSWQRIYRLGFAHEELYRRPSDEAFARARQLLDTWDDSSDPQMRSIVHSGWAGVELLAGDAEAAFSHAIAVESERGLGVGTAAAAALWSGNVAHIEHVIAMIDDLPTSGRFVTALRGMLEATIDAAEGRAGDAEAGFMAAIDALDTVGTAVDRAQARAVFASVMGQDTPEAEAASRAARDWIESVGAVQLLRVWSTGLPAESDASAAG